MVSPKSVDPSSVAKFLNTSSCLTWLDLPIFSSGSTYCVLCDDMFNGGGDEMPVARNPAEAVNSLNSALPRTLSEFDGSMVRYRSRPKITFLLCNGLKPMMEKLTSKMLSGVEPGQFVGV